MDGAGLMQWIQDQVRGVRNNFRSMRGDPSLEEEERGKLISPIPDSQRVDMQPPSFEHATPNAMSMMEFEGEPPVQAPQQPQQPQQPVAPMQSPTPAPQQVSSNMMAEFNPSQYRESGDFEIAPLPDEIAEQVKETFGKEAGRAAVVMGTENQLYDPGATYQNKGDNGMDVGLFQVNSNTLDDFLRRKPKKFEEIGVSDVDDLKDPIKNIKAAKIIFDEQGWNAWYGPRNKGYNVYD